ncbi:flagellin N-terminal helical domain-containing protein [Salinarimonas ramus]|uniref:Flagellin n=1 Tax=Salinarimonas ramus TaxID=690164 RepID=A0A917V2W0_9HYPH|nr:flagellin [Salinarimonas ramus]GGK27224.1 flagellin [Salinarimonas ramus]
MSSLLTNSSAMTALQTLTATNKKMDATQNRIATGMRVSSAADNAAYWSIATTMRSDNKALSAVQDALGLGAATVDTMYTALNATVDVVSEIKAKLVAARTPGVDRGKIQSEIGELQSQLRNTADSAVFNGENWLAYDSSDPAYNTTKTIVASFSRAGGAVAVDTISIDLTSIELYDDADQSGILDTVGGSGQSVATIDISALTDAPADLTTLETYISEVDAALGQITDAATNLGAIKNRIGLQQDFVKALMDSIDRGVGQLVDADMNAESTRLQALQTQQQLGIQALTIANSNSQNILSLFR